MDWTDFYTIGTQPLGAMRPDAEAHEGRMDRRLHIRGGIGLVLDEALSLIHI